MMTYKMLWIMAFGLGSATAFAQLQLADIFGDHMVLQQQAPVVIWGRAAAKSQVTVTCSWAPETPVSVRAAANGIWEATINTPTGSKKAQEIRITNGSSSRVLSDVLIGEVWLCSGQSNMEYQVELSGYSPAQTQAANYPHIRHCKVQHAVALSPQDTANLSEWAVCNDSTVQQFSAVAYFFARDLAEKYHLPVGIVNSTWGGSQVESWISGKAMEQSAVFRAYMEQFPQNWDAADAMSLSKIKRYLFSSDQTTPTAAQELAYLLPDYDVSNWKKATPNLAWDWQRIWAFRGSGFMVHDFFLMEQEVQTPVLLHLGHGDLPAELYVNGIRFWQGTNTGTLAVSIPVSLLKTGKNRLLFKQSLGQSTGWVEMGMRGDAADFYLKTAVQKISLADKWHIMPSFHEPLYFVHSSNNLGTAIFNAMIHPITRFAIKGVIWFQGESNAIRAEAYRQSFPLLIQDWRQQWGKDFPFLFVQLANWEAESGNSRVGSEWAELREAQASALALPNTGMAVTIDIGDSKDIHPKNKRDVGRRLAYEALRTAYQESLPPRGGLTPQIAFFGSRVLVSYPLEKPLVTTDRYGYVRGIEVAGADQVFHYAQASISGNALLIHCDAVPTPVAVRYAWADDPNDANVFTHDGFPIPPFRSDNWKCRTAGISFE